MKLTINPKWYTSIIKTKMFNFPNQTKITFDIVYIVSLEIKSI